ncbi:MAG: GNAT family N-acetyltransferase [DPANN group archaeon]|nr:GNAT family N-acetyltransferase [DPANN group archaeon]
MPSIVAEPIYDVLEQPTSVTLQDHEINAPLARPVYLTETVSTLAGMLRLEHEWDDLAKRSGAYSIFSTFHWNLVWARRFLKDNELFIVVVRHQGRLIGLAPLMLGHSKVLGITQKTLMFMGTPLNDYSEFLLSEDKELVVRLLWEHILKESSRWSIVVLEEMPQDSASLVLSEHCLADKDVYSSTIYCNDCFALDMDRMDKQALDQYMRKRDVLRNIRKLDREDPLVFERVRTKGQVRQTMATFIDQHVSLWQKKGVASSFIDKDHRTFVKELVEAFFDEGHFGVWRLRNTREDSILAILQGFIYEGTLFGYFKSYNLDYAKRGPGMIATKYLLEQAQQEGFRRIDFSRGAEPYKLKLANIQKKNLGILVTKNHITHLFNRGYHRTKEKVMADPKLHQRMHDLKNRPLFRTLFSY